MVSDLEIEIDLKEPVGFDEVYEFYEMFNNLINCLRDISSYGIKLRGKHLDEWIENPELSFNK